ncbi:MAG: phosphate acyltransferase [Epulopiscium sp. Nuni2H_MBin001]|nr:MAG: phosphate acyltransferase [Epulopiscium sp. Nuni2H_MBin001]
MMKIAIDAMGGDYAPVELIKGCIKAAKTAEAELVLIGQEEAIKTELKKYEYDRSKIKILNANGVITMDDSFSAVRTKKDSSMVVGLNLVKDGKVDAFISAGNSGALVAGATTIVGRLKGVSRPALTPLIPTKKGYSLLIDAGANVDAKPEFLHHFAKIGSVYMQACLGIQNPKVGLINIGTEVEKGNKLTKETYPLLQEDSDINFIGNIEAREIPEGEADVLVCDAFVGNVILKFMEGFGNWVFSMVKFEFTRNIATKVAALLMKKGVGNIKKKFYYNDQGGAPLLGIKGIVIKIHGNSKDTEMASAILQAEGFVRNKLIEKISEKFVNLK